MENITTYEQLKEKIFEAGFSDVDLKIILNESTNNIIRFGIACHIDDLNEARDIINSEESLEYLYRMIPSADRNRFINYLIERALVLVPINIPSDAMKFNQSYSFFEPSDLEHSPALNLIQKVSLAAILNPSLIKDNSWDKEILNTYDLSELQTFFSDIRMVYAVLPLNPVFFVKNIMGLDDQVVNNYLVALKTQEISAEEAFDAISLLNGNYIYGKIIISDNQYIFEFENSIQETLFNAFNLKYQIIESNALYTEKELGAESVDGEMRFVNGKICVDLKIEELNSLESFKAQVFGVLSTAVTTIGKVASNPKTKMAMMALSAFGVMGEAWGADVDSESGIASVLNKIEKAHTLKGFEGGKQFNALDAQLEQIGVDLNDLKFPANFDHRTIRFSGEEGDYSLKMGDTTVSFEYQDDGMYSTTIKNIGGSSGLIDAADLKEWATKITNNLNKAVKASEAE